MNATLIRKWHRKGIGKRPSDFADSMYLYEVELQCEFAQRSFGQMQEVFGVSPRNPSLLALAHMLLVCAGNVAKLITTTKDAAPKSRERAARLGDMLGFKNEKFSVVRRARNFFEHFDERMDKHIGEADGLIIQRLIQDHEPTDVAFDDGRIYRPKFMQFLNTTTWEVTLYGERFALLEVLDLLKAVRASSQAALQKMGATTTMGASSSASN